MSEELALWPNQTEQEMLLFVETRRVVTFGRNYFEFLHTPLARTAFFSYFIKKGLLYEKHSLKVGFEQDEGRPDAQDKSFSRSLSICKEFLF